MEFYELNRLSLAQKIGVSIPIGNENEGFGSGKVGCYGYAVMSLSIGQMNVHANAGYIINRNRLNERENIWHASAALEYILIEDSLRLLANAGLDRNSSKRSNIYDAFILGGIILSPGKNIDIDIGYKYSIESKKFESPGPNHVLLAGLTMRFFESSKIENIN
jgi:hypothetical protein